MNQLNPPYERLNYSVRRSGRFAWWTAFLLLFACGPEPESPVEWRTYQGDSHRNQYSPLSRINRTNVSELQLAWTYRTGDAPSGVRSEIQCNPLIVDGVLYGTSPAFGAFALDARTGQEIWKFQPFDDQSRHQGLLVNRGVHFWEDGDDRRIFYSARHYLLALDARTGRPVQEFGTAGRVDLRIGLDRDPERIFVAATSPGAVFEDLIIMGTRVSEGPDAAPGDVRAYDARSGQVRWTFRTIPAPREYGADTWPPDARKKAGGANSWAGMSLDPERGVVYVPTGSPAFDFYGGNRKGRNLFGNSILALDARTGERIWHYQVVRHDLWDRDLPAPPNLVTLQVDGKPRDVVAQITKSGHVFVLDRDTGEPVFPIEEIAVPPSDLEGEEAWPTQPLPLKPPAFSRQRFTEAEITRRTPEAYAAVKARFDQGLRTGEPFIPPSREGTVVFPGFDGGAEWGGAAFDAEAGILYVNSNEMPWILAMVRVIPPGDRRFLSRGEVLYRAQCATCHGIDRIGDPALVPTLENLHERSSAYELFRLFEYGSGQMPAFQNLTPEEQNAIAVYLLRADLERAPEEVAEIGEVPPQEPSDILYTNTGWHRFLDPDGYPAITPPWGQLTAIDLNRSEIVWQVPFGEYPELTAQGHPLTGTENYGGPVVTGGGLLFIGATRDEKFRAFDKATGEILWEFQLPAAGYATPSIYEVDGRQFVVIAAGGGKLGTKSGDAYLAFALPE